MNSITDWSRNYRVEVGGDEVGSHAGNVITRMLADRTGLTEQLSAAISRPEVTHDRGALLRDVAVSIADGATNLSGSRVLRDQQRLFGEVASLPTMWRGLNEIDAAALEAITVARNKTRGGCGNWVPHGTPRSRRCAPVTAIWARWCASASTPA